MNKFKCKHCNNETNLVVYMEGFKGCTSCLGDKYKSKKVSELNV